LKNRLKASEERYQVREKHFAAQLRIQVLEHELAERKLKQQIELYERETLRVCVYVDCVVLRVVC
jgi:hypothetical protein